MLPSPSAPGRGKVRALPFKSTLLSEEGRLQRLDQSAPSVGFPWPEYRRMFVRKRDNRRVAAISYLDRLLDPLTDVLTPEVARAVLGLHADPELEARIAELRSKANEGTLTPVEDTEYKDFVEAVDLISIIQTKARRFLANHPG